MSSRNPAYDSGESRRSPRDRSPGRYNDSRDSDQYRDRGGPMRAERRRSIPDSRSNHGAFASNRDSFGGRDSRDFASRDPPRGPKELIDAPTGPRASGYGNNFRGDISFRGSRGRGGRGRPWGRDDSRDRGRDSDRDFNNRDRDRREERFSVPNNNFRDDRSRDRDRWDRDSRDNRDNFRGRRPSSPQGRGRSPNYSHRDGPRDSRDGPLNLDLDRARRGSRDGPLSAGSPSSEALQPPFGRGGYTRGRGPRGRGRGYYDDFQRPQPHRSRSPEPSSNWARRTQPSATPPPQVPAFGSTSAQTPTAPGSLPPSVPTAPRSHNPKPVPITRNVNPNRIPSSSYKWTKPPDKDPSESRFQDANQPESPRSVGKPPRIVTDTQSVANRDDISPRESVFSREALSTGDRVSPRDKGPDIAHPLDKESASPKVENTENKVTRAPEKAPDEQPPVQTRKEPSKRRAVVGRRPPKLPSPARSPMYMSEDSEDSEDGLDDSYFETQIASVQDQILKAEEQNPLEPRSDLDNDIDIVKPLRLSINDIVATKPLNAVEPCEAPFVKPEPSPQPPSALAPEPKPKPKGLPSTTREGDSFPSSKVNGKDVVSNSEPLASAKTEIGNTGGPSNSAVLSNTSMENPSTRTDAPDGRILPQLRNPLKTMTNGQSSKVDEYKEPQGLQNQDTHMENGVTVTGGLGASAVGLNGSHVPHVGDLEPQASLPSQSAVGNISLIPERPRMEHPAESQDEQNLRKKQEELDAVFYQAVRAVKPVPSGRAAMYKGPFAQANDQNLNGNHSQQDLAAVRKMMKTPPISRLPKFNVGSCWDDPNFLTSLEVRNPIIDEKLRRKLREQAMRRKREQEEEGEAWEQRYRDFREWTDFSEDPVAVRSREVFAESRARAAAEAAAPPASSVASAATKPEGRRPGRYATERDLERVLRESEQEAREKKDQDERAARAKTASTKEAIIPDMCWDDEEWGADVFKDRTHAVSFERSFAVLEYGEPIDNFSEEEAATFEKVYLEFPKQFDKIAAALPKRDFKACIQHYYLVKHPLDLKPKAREREKKKKGRRGPAKGSKPKANALTASLGTVDDNDDGQENEDRVDGRRRPRRAAAPVFPIDAPVSENEVASPAPTPGRKSAAAPKSDTGNESGPRKKVKIAPQKTAKQAKNSQPIAAAPIAAANRQMDSPAPPAPEWKNRKEPSGSNRFPSQFDGTPQGPPTTTFAPPFVGADRPGPSMAPSFEVTPQPYPSQERVDSNTPMGFDPQQDRRNIQQTSSYWSVPEVNDFPALLRHFGTDWQGIAKHMTSKTHIMVYQNLFHQWLTVPLDTNKSRRVANIQTQVKNYYQRSVDSGKNREWEDIAKEADAKRERGEPTGPLPAVTPIPSKKRFENTQGTVPRSGSAMEGIEDMSSPGMNAVMTQASPPQGVVSTRFPALAQAGPVPHIQPAPSASALNKPLPPQAQQQAPQAQHGRSRGPQLGYFNTESPRPILQAQQSDPTISQRSRQVAQEAKIEREAALRVEQEQKQQREQLQNQRAAEQQQQQHLALQQQQQQSALQRERHYPTMKQENDVTNLNQVEAYSTPPMHSNLQAHSRPEAAYQPPHPEVRRSTVPPQLPQQYQPRPTHQAVRSLLSDSAGVPREMKPSPSPSHGPSHAPPPMPTPRAPVSAPPVSREQYQVPPQPKPQVPQVAAARQQETVRKTSNIMSLLNDDEPSNPRPEPPRRVANVSSTPQPTSQTPPPLPQMPLQTNRFAAHSSQPPQPPQHAAHQQQTPQHSVSQQAPPQPHSNPYAQPDPYARAAPQPTHQHSSSIGHPRSFTPTGFDGRGYSAKPSMPPQPMYPQQQSRQSMAPQPSAIRREASLGESVHPGGLSGGYSRSGPGSSSMRLQESPYSSTSSPAPTQAGRQQIASPLDLAPPGERDYYSRQPQYMLQQQQGSAAGSPQLGPSHYTQPQAPPPSNHRQLAFGQTQSHMASPPSHYATQHIQRSRHNSFDGRFPATGSAGSTPSHPGYAQPPHHQAGPPQMPYQQSHPSQERFGESSYDRDVQQRRMAEERRVLEDRRIIDERERRIMEDRDRRIAEDRRIEENRRMEEHYRRSMEERR